VAEPVAGVAEGVAPGEGSPSAAGRAGFAPWVLAVAVAAAYATSFLGDFQFDDLNVIVNEPRVHSLGAWWASMPGVRPILKASYALNWSSGLGLPGFHAVNLAVHVANSLLAWALLRRLGPCPPGAALLGALFFALHPADTEAVTYVSGRSSSLSASFALASLLAFTAGDQTRSGPSRALSPLLFLASLLVKESAAVLPFCLLLLEASFGPRPFHLGAALRRTAAHWLVLGAWSAAVLGSPTYHRMLAKSLELRPPLANVLTQVQALAWLSGQVLRIDLLDADPELPAVGVFTPTVALEALALLAALGLGLRYRRRPVGFAVLWFLLWLPASGWWLPRAEPANDRQLYLAILGPAWLAGRRLAPLATGVRRAVAFGLVVLLGVATGARNLAYADEVRFWEDVLRKSPRNARAYNNLAFALAERCETARAEAMLLRALEIDPDYVRARVNLRLLQDGEPLAPLAPGQRGCETQRPPPPSTTPPSD